jgi:tRNA threonylcarbamoyladenosine biosynthesis protein TsaB
MGEVYAAAFERSGDGLVHLIGIETVGAARMLVLPRSGPWHVIGTGWDTYADALQARMGVTPRSAEGHRYPQASAIARLAVRELADGHGLAPEFAMPTYLRDKVALTSSEQASSRLGG